MDAMWKKLLSLLLVLTMLVGLTPAVFASEEAVAEPEEQAEEMLPEENGGAEDPADADEPGIGEEPGDPDTPAVTPEEPDTPGDPNTPEDPVPGEEPVTSEEPAEEPDAEEVPEDEDDEFDMDIEIQSEGLGERKLTLEPKLSIYHFERVSYVNEDNEVRYDGYRIKVGIDWTQGSADLAYAIIAESKSMRYYLEYDNKKDLKVGYYRLSDPINISLPAGEYDIRAVAWNPDNDPSVRTYYASPAGAKKLIVLPAPEVVSMTPASEDNDGSIKLKDPNNTDILDLVVNGTPEYDKHTTVLPNLAYGDYVLYYRGFDTVPNQPGNDNAVVIDSAITAVVVPYQAGAWNFQAYINIDGKNYYPEGGAVPLYKGDEVTISTYVEGEDNRLSFKSDNTKVAAVDVVGNVKAVGLGTATITVTSLAGAAYAFAEGDPPYPTFIELTVTVQDFSPKTFKFEKAKQTVEWNPYLAIYGTDPTVTLLTDSNYQADQVTYSISGGEEGGLYFLDKGNHAVNILTTDARTLELHVHAGGVYNVTAKLHGKTASCTVQVDGFNACVPTGPYPTEESVFYSGGKPFKGWIAWDEDNHRYLRGKNALAGGSEALAKRSQGYGIFYAGSDGKLLKENVFKIDGKLYQFTSFGRLYLDINTDDPLHPFVIEGFIGNAYQDAAGHLRTGWQKKNNGDPIYLDPTSGYLVTGTWVPYGKGVTWVDYDGVPENVGGDSVLEKGIHVYNIGQYPSDTVGAPYAFQDGVRYTGWIYAEGKGESAVYKTKSFSSVEYKLYFNPNLNGAQDGTEYGDAFWVDGKEYRIGSMDGWTGVLMPRLTGYSAKTNLFHAEDGGVDPWVSAPDGSVIKGALVDAYDYKGSQEGTYYAYSDGSLARDALIAVQGTSYYFGDDCMLTTAEINNDDTTGYTGLFVKVNGGDFADEHSYSSEDSITAKPINPEKAKEGYCYYYNGNMLLTDCILYRKSSDSWYPRFALDKNGRTQTGPAVVTARPDIGSSVSESYVINANGTIPYGYTGYPGDHNPITRTEIKGKLYASDAAGRVLRDGWYAARYSHEGDGVFYADKSGALARGGFRTFKGIGKVYFSEGGVVDNERISTFIIVQDKTYLMKAQPVTVTRVSNYSTGTTAIGVVDVPAKAGFVSYGNYNPILLYINKDGSVKLGWVTYPDKTKRYMTINRITDKPYDLLGVWKINGKSYCLSKEGVMQTGWIWCDAYLYDMAIYLSTYGDGNEARIGAISGWFYFDPMTGAMVTGGWKTVQIGRASCRERV